MNKHKNFSNLMIGTLLFASISVQTVYCTTFGSQTDPTRYNTQQQVRSGDLIDAFAAMEGGFAFFDTSNTATFNSFFGVSGYTALNGGTLILLRDFIVQDEGYFQNIGNIEGNKHVVSLAPNITTFPLMSPHNCKVNLKATYSAVLGGPQGGEWSSDGKYYVLAGANQVAVFQLVNEGLVLIATAAATSGTLTQARWHPFLYRFVLCSAPTGTSGVVQTFTFDPTMGTITQDGSVTYSTTANSVAWHPSGIYLTVGITGSILTIPVNNDNTLNLANTYTIAGVPGIPSYGCDWNVTGSYLAVANIVSSSRVYRFNQYPTPLLTSIATYGSSWGVAWNKTTTNVFAGAGFASPQVRVFRFNEPNSLTSLATIVSPAVNEGRGFPVWGGCTCFAVNQGSELNQSNMVQVYDIDLLVTNSLKLVQALSFPATPNRYVAYNGNYLVQPAGTLLYLYQNVNFGPPPQFVFSDVNLRMNNNTFFNNSNILFRGNCSIDGNNNIFKFSPTSLIKVDRASTLQLSNIVIEGIRNGKISCTDSSSTLTLSNAIMQLDTSVSFTAGRIDILGDLKLTGSSASFDYRSTESLTIYSNASLIVDSGITFSYSPNNLSTSLLQFIDGTSKFILQGGSLVASATGLNLTKGTFIANRISTLRSIGRTIAQGIIFGDGTNRVNNMVVSVKPAATLSCNGIIVYNNI